MFIKVGGKFFGERIVSESEERDIIIRELYQLGYAGINKIQKVIVSNYVWFGMQDAVKR